MVEVFNLDHIIREGNYNTETERPLYLKVEVVYVPNDGNKYGYVDKNNVVVVNYIYDDATEQNKYGFVAVKENGLWGALDKEGKEVIEPKYNLDNNLKIDFIGKWHLGEDLNMNYYCEK